MVRLENKTARRGEYIPYCMIESLHQYIKSCNNEQILDIGCGENNNKLFFPNIIGFDKTHEADIFGWQHDDAWNNLPQFENGIAVNSLHWNNIGNNIEKAVEKCKRIFISLNENQDITIFKNLLKYSILEKYGGLWLPLDTLVLREFNIGYLNTDKLILFKKNPKYINFDEGFSDQIIFYEKE